MNGFRLARAWSAACVLAAVGLLALGCSKKITSVDVNYTMPEGRYSPEARLIVYPDVEVNLLEYFDKAPVGPDAGDSLIGTVPARLIAPGILYGLVLDSTGATSYQMLRRETGGGFLPLKDFVLHPVVRWLETHWEAYSFLDLTPGGYDPTTFLGRGLVGGTITTNSPLTNPALISGVSETPMSIAITGYAPRIKIRTTGAAMIPIRFSGQFFPPDSLFRLSWGPVTGAAGYWVQVFQYFGAPTGEIIINGLPSPLATGHLVDYKLAYLPAPDTLYKIGTTSVELLADKKILVAGAYLVRITAVDANGRMIGFSFGDADVALGETSYIVYPLGGFVVEPRRPMTASRATAPPLGLGRLTGSLRERLSHLR